MHSSRKIIDDVCAYQFKSKYIEDKRQSIREGLRLSKLVTLEMKLKKIFYVETKNDLTKEVCMVDQSDEIELIKTLISYDGLKCSIVLDTTEESKKGKLEFTPQFFNAKVDLNEVEYLEEALKTNDKVAVVNVSVPLNNDPYPNMFKLENSLVIDFE